MAYELQTLDVRIDLKCRGRSTLNETIGVEREGVARREPNFLRDALLLWIEAEQQPWRDVGDLSG